MTDEETIRRLHKQLWSRGLPFDRVGGVLTLDEERLLLSVAEAALTSDGDALAVERSRP